MSLINYTCKCSSVSWAKLMRIFWSENPKIATWKLWDFWIVSNDIIKLILFRGNRSIFYSSTYRLDLALFEYRKPPHRLSSKAGIPESQPWMASEIFWAFQRLSRPQGPSEICSVFPSILTLGLSCKEIQPERFQRANWEYLFPI